MKKTVLITGCSSGFGFELVPELLKRGHRVIATARGLEKRPELFSEERRAYPQTLMVHELDVTSQDQRKKLHEMIATKFSGKLDVLVNNAGYGLFGALEDMDDSQLRQQMEVNFFAVSAMIREFLPFLRETRGTIFNLSSALGYSAMPLTSAYVASKFALEGLSEALSFELAPLGVQVCLIQPGGHRTAFGKNVVWAKRAFDERSPYLLQSQNYFALLQKLMRRKPVLANGVVLKVAALVDSDKVPMRVRCGKDAHATYVMRRALPNRAFHPLMGKIFRKIFQKNGSSVLPKTKELPSGSRF